MHTFLLGIGVLLAAVYAALRESASDPPTDWVDPDTGHRVLRLSTEPGSASLYFHQNAYTPNGQKLIITTPTGLATVDLKTRALESVVTGRANVVVTGRRTGDVYYVQDGTVCAARVDTRATRQIGRLPPGGSVGTLNADETLLAGALMEGDGGSSRAPRKAGPDADSLSRADAIEVRLNNRLEERRPMALFTMSTATGEVQTLYRSTDWLNHFQFSPTDPTLLMFCHEGPWHRVDRIWTIRTDGSRRTKVHTRTMNMEIAGHEFWSADGRTIWYDLQTPRGEDFWVAGFEVETGRRLWYHLERDAWSVHFNVSADGTLFAGDGGDELMVAHARDGKWISLFRPQATPDVAGIQAPDAQELIRPGRFEVERLVNMSRHDYGLEPNVTFTPDGKWVVFRSNMFGPTHVFAAEVEKALAL